MNRTLRYGARGDDVTDLQQGLNKLLPNLTPLAADGIFGMKTYGRVQEFQRAHSLAADGIVGPITWGVLLELLSKIISTPPPQPQDHWAVLRQKTLNIAQQHIGKVNFLQMEFGKPKGLELVKKFFQEAANIALTDANFKHPVTKAWNAEPFVGGKAKSWCGIFCVYCYRIAGLTSLHWDLSAGKAVGPIHAVSWNPHYADGIRAADMGWVQTKSHHFLIEKVLPGNQYQPNVASIDGNGFAGVIERKTSHQVGKDNFVYYTLN